MGKTNWQKWGTIIALITLIIVFFSWIGYPFYIYPGTSSGQSQWMLCTPSSTSVTCSVSQGQFAPKGSVDGISWDNVHCFWTGCASPSIGKVMSVIPNKCSFTGTVKGLEDCPPSNPTFFSGTRYGTVGGDACIFDEPVAIGMECPNRLDIGGSVIFYYEEPVMCNVASDCEGKTHIDCVGHWECTSNECVWQCDDIPPPPPPPWDLRQFILDIITSIQAFFCTYFGLWCV